ncbi:Uncharacterised protein [Escherichia coli]|nr:Uncharacterised protein [Escherichia coli]SQR52361.1 Uncharacterised protein [Escherichia coli]SQS09771.1 Uncharacterised protein [Escherichia coli]
MKFYHSESVVFLSFYGNSNVILTPPILYKSFLRMSLPVYRLRGFLFINVLEIDESCFFFVLW